MSVLIAGLLLAFAELQTPVPAQLDEPAASIDMSGVDAFWQIADRIQQGATLSPADWDTFFQHPGYAQIQRSGGRRRVLETCLPAVFASEETERAGRLSAVSSAFVRDICTYLDRVRSRRQALDAFRRDADLELVYDGGLQLAALFLPPAAEGRERPTVYVMLFEENGFGGEVIAADLNLIAERGTDSTARYLGHEFHHFFRERLQSRSQAPPIAQPLTEALDALPREGAASLIDKELFLAPGFSVESLAPIERETVREFLTLYDDVPATLRAIDRLLAAIPPDATGQTYAEAARSLDLPWGGHPAGLYLARTIDRTQGREVLNSVMLDPWRFLAAYQDAAGRSGGGLFLFPPEAERLIRQFAAPSN